MTSSRFCWKGPCAHSSTSTQPCLHVTVCTNVQCCIVCGWVRACVVAWWCGGCKEKGKTQTHSQTKTKRTFAKTTFSHSPFFLLFFFHSFLLAFHSPTITSFLSTHSHVPCFVYECICDEPKTPMTQHLFHFIVFSFCPNSLFPLLFLLLMIPCWWIRNPTLSYHQIKFI